MEPQSAFEGIQWYEKLDSTNNEAKRRLESIDNLSVLAAVNQTAGRGRGGHTWVSRPGENLTFSLVLKFAPGALAAQDAVRITHFCTVSLCCFLEGEGVVPRIKWPNDIWVGGRKICGILIENSFSEGCVSSSIIGIGLNLNQKEFDPLLPNPSSLSLVTGREYEPAKVLDSLYEIFCRLSPRITDKDGSAQNELEFSKRMFVLEKPLQDRISASVSDFEAAK